MTMKIAYILQHFPLPSETFVINEIIALQSLGFEVSPVAIFSSPVCQQLLMSQVRKPTLDLSSIALPEVAAATPFFSKAITLAERYQLSEVLGLAAAVISQHVTQNGIELLHAHFAAQSALTAMLASELTGVPFTLTAHAYDIFIRNEGPPGETRDSRLRLLARQAKRFVTVSRFNKDFLTRIVGPEYEFKVDVIHCGIDTGSFKPMQREPIETVTFLCVGRLVEKKGHSYLLRAFKQLSLRHDHVRLLIVGDGPQETTLKAICTDLGLSEKVVFKGALPSEAILEEMRIADIFVLPSITAGNGDREGIPISIMEASATGLPVISTLHSGIPELVIDGRSGYLVPEKDVDLLAQRMEQLAVSNELRTELGQAGSRLVAEQFNLCNEARKLANMFSLVARGRLMTTALSRPTGTAISNPGWDQTMKVSVIIPFYNAAATLPACLQSIDNLEFPKEQLEVIVVDNNSTDDSAEIAKRFQVTLLSETTIQSSYAARNTGIRAASGDLIAFTDADCIVTPGWLKHLLSGWDDTTAGCFAGEIEAYEPETVVEVFSQREGILRQACTFGAPYLPYPQTANAAYRRNVLDQVGLFVPEMTSGGDADLAWRMQKQLGMSIRFIPEALVYHKHRTNLQGLYNQFYKYEFGKLFLKKQYPDYPFMQVEERKRELEYSIWNLYSKLRQNILPLANGQIDFTDFVSPFLKMLMHAGTFKARVDIERNAGTFSETCITDTPSFKSEEDGEILRLSAVTESQQLLLQQKSEELAQALLALEQNQAESKQMRQRIDDLLNSASWKITAPLRWMLDLAKLK